MTRQRRRAVLLDRDGVLNERPACHEYVRTEAEFRLLPGTVEALSMLAAAGYLLVVVSNQRGIARGLVTWSVLRAIERRIQHALRSHGVGVAAFYYCPHDVDDGCGCRKPAPGLLLRAARDLELDLAECVLVGDSETDIAAGRACRCLTIRVGEDRTQTSARVLAPDLPAVAALLAARETVARPGYHFCS